MSLFRRRGAVRNEIKRASHSQNAEKYGFNAGKQCVGNALAYTMVTHGKDWTNVKRSTLNKVLDLGDHIYGIISDYVHKTHLEPSETPSEVTWEGNRYEFNHGAHRVGSILADTNRLVGVLANVFMSYPHAFFLCQTKCVMLTLHKGSYFCFDSHIRDVKGLPTKDGVGVGCAMKFVDFMSMVKHLKELYHDTVDAQYDIIPLKTMVSVARTTETGRKLYLNFDRPVCQEIYIVGSEAGRVELSKQCGVHDIQFPSSYESNTPNGKRRRSDERDVTLVPLAKRACNEKANVDVIQRIRQINAQAETAVASSDGVIYSIDSEVIDCNPVEEIPFGDPGISEVTEEPKSAGIRVKFSRLNGKWVCHLGTHGHKENHLTPKLLKKVQKAKKKKNTRNGSSVHVDDTGVCLNECLSDFEGELSTKESRAQDNGQSQESLDDGKALDGRRRRSGRVPKRREEMPKKQTSPSAGTERQLLLLEKKLERVRALNAKREKARMHKANQRARQKEGKVKAKRGRPKKNPVISLDNDNVLEEETQIFDGQDEEVGECVVGAKSTHFGKTNYVDEKLYNPERTLNLFTNVDMRLDCVCCVCYCMFFKDEVIEVKKKQYKDYMNPTFKHGKVLHACKKCSNSIKEKKVPRISYINGVCFPEKPKELDITQEEERLIALRLPFMQLKLLPTGGQLQLFGNVVNVPAKIQETVHMLPRYVNNSGNVCVRLKRKLQYTAVYRSMNIRPLNVLCALRWLLDNSEHYMYRQVQINENWLKETLDFLSQSEDIDEEDNAEDHRKSNSVTIGHRKVKRGQKEKEKVAKDIVRSYLNARTNGTTCESENEFNVTEYSSSDDSDNEDSSTTDSDTDQDSDTFSEVDKSETRCPLNTLLDQEEDNLYLDIAPGQGQVPIYMPFDKDVEELSNPTVYCGKSIKDIFKNISFLDRVRWELRCVDRRVVQLTESVFLRYKMYQQKYIQQTVQFAVRFIKQKKDYKAKHVRDVDKRTNLATIDEGYYFFRNLRNSPQYLQQQKKNLFCMIRQLGLPTFFVSLSAADMHWPDLLASLFQIVHNRVPSEEEIAGLQFQDKSELIKADPVTCVRYFDHKFQRFLRGCLYSADCPLGAVIDHYYRVEFQHRGSPHVHMLVFCKDAPRYHEGKGNQDLLAYIDRYVSCSATPGGDTQQYIPLQTHQHSTTCRKGGHPICRFGYPLPPFNETIILQPNPEKTQREKNLWGDIQLHLKDGPITEETTLQDLLNHFKITQEEYILAVRSSLRSTKVFLKRKPSECRINMYMKNLLHIWKANVDCQVCIDAYSIVVYILNYINKQNRGLSIALQTMIKECKEDQNTIKETIRKLGSVFLKSSEVCVQESIYILLGLPITANSRDVIGINTEKRRKRIQVLKSDKLLNELDKNSQEIYVGDKFTKYMNRPTYFEKWTLADYTTGVTRTDTRENSKKKNYLGERITPKQLKYIDENYTYSVRPRNRILKYHMKLRNEDEEEYFRVLLLVFRPWREDPEIVQQRTKQSYLKLFEECDEQTKADMFTALGRFNAEKIQHLESVHVNVLQDRAIDFAPGCEEREVKDIMLGKVNVEDQFFVPKKDDKEHESGSFTGATAVCTVIESMWPQKELLKTVNILNQKQRNVFDHIMKHICHKNERLHVFISGSGGSGKSVVLKTLYQAMSRHYNLSRTTEVTHDSVLTLAYTGKAAFLIGGQTIHSALHLNPNDNYERHVGLNRDVLNTLRLKFRHVKVILFDEVSMIGIRFFHYISSRLQHIMANNEPFGNLHVICFGDLYQLPPVGDLPVYRELEKGLPCMEENLWKSKFKYFELTQSMRQCNDLKFAEVLNKIRDNTFGDPEIEYLKKLSITEKEDRKNNLCTHLYFKNADVDAYNQICFDRCRTKKDSIRSNDFLSRELTPERLLQVHEQLLNIKKTAGIPYIVNVGVGLTYDIVSNLDVGQGLANGSTCILRHIQYMKGYKKPAVLWMEFDNPKIGAKQRDTFKHYRPKDVEETLVPLFPVTTTFFIGKTLQVKRHQFAVRQSSSKTIHKSQGSTYEEVSVCLKNSKVRNLFYVAASRVKESKNLHLINFDKGEIVYDPLVPKEVQRLRTKMPLHLNFPVYTPEDNKLIMYYQNVQSLYGHSACLKADKTGSSASVILLCETHLLETDDIENFALPGMSLVRFDCSTKKNGKRPSHGLAIYHNENIELCDLHSKRFPNCEFLLVQLKYLNYKFTYAVVYCQPKCGKQQMYDMCQELENVIFNQSQTEGVMVFGDFNVDASSNKGKRVIRKMEDILHLQQIVNTYTTRGHTTLDLCFSSYHEDTSVKDPVETHYLPWSYHFGLSTQLHLCE